MFLLPSDRRVLALFDQDGQRTCLDFVFYPRIMKRLNWLQELDVVLRINGIAGLPYWQITVKGSAALHHQAIKRMIEITEKNGREYLYIAFPECVVSAELITAGQDRRAFSAYCADNEIAMDLLTKKQYNTLAAAYIWRIEDPIHVRYRVLRSEAIEALIEMATPYFNDQA